MDTLIEEKLRVAQLNSRLAERNFQIETLNTDLAEPKMKGTRPSKNKNSLTILGIR